jgi:hypothetical protein
MKFCSYLSRLSISQALHLKNNSWLEKCKQLQLVNWLTVVYMQQYKSIHVVVALPVAEQFFQANVDFSVTDLDAELVPYTGKDSKVEEESEDRLDERDNKKKKV